MIIALDPGKTTGGFTILASGQPHWFEVDGLNPLWRQLQILRPTTIVYEKFSQRMKAADLAPVEVIGAIKLYNEMLDIPIVPQSSSQAKGVMDNAKLKAWGFYKPGMKHATDAARHYMYYSVVTLGQTKWLEVLKV